MVADTIVQMTGVAMVAHRISRVLRYATIALAVTAMWVIATVPSGFSALQLALFAGPGMVLTVAMSWTAHAFAPEEFDWGDTLRAGVVGAVAFPPLVGFFVAWTTTFSPNVMVVLLVLSSWFALGAGLLAAIVRLLARKRREHSGAHRLVHLEMLD
jgi:hypothetical protein